MKYILNEPPMSARQNMEGDSELLETIGEEPILRFYNWRGPAATYGHFITPEQHFYLEEAVSHNLDLARRPTGGGVIFHIGDLAFSVIVPKGHPAFTSNTLDSYSLINRAVASAICRYTEGRIAPELFSQNNKESKAGRFCMARPTIYDLMASGKKIGGAAQRRTKKGFLHQGAILLAPPPEELVGSVLKKGPAIYSAMLNNSRPLLPSPNDPEGARCALQQALRQSLEQTLRY